MIVSLEWHGKLEAPPLRPVAGAGGEYERFVACHFAEELDLRGVIALSETVH